MEIKNLHDWNLSFPQACALQRQLYPKLKIKPIQGKVRSVAGLDCSIRKDIKKLICAVVVTEYGTDNIIETQFTVTDLKMPYVPGFLSFREGFGCLETVKKLTFTPDVFVIDGQGIAHPRKMGLAAHLGLFLDVPTVGCAKSRLIGEYEDFKLIKGNYSDLRVKDEILGAVLCSRNGIKPLFVSPGHKCDIKDSIKIVLENAIKYRLPEPTRRAHLLVTQIKKNFNNFTAILC